MLKLTELLNDPESTLDLLENPLWMFSPAEQDAFRRCAVVRTVDEELYRNVLLNDVPVEERVPYETILSSNFVKRFGGPRARCELSSDLRGELLRQWWGDKIPGSRSIPDELRDLSSRLAGAFEARDMPIEQLYHLLLADEPQAARLCQSMLEKAKDSFDLALYYDLLRVYNERESEIGTSLLTSEQERQRRLLRRDYETRALFRSAWYATSYYVQRPNLANLYKNLTSPEGNWIVQLYAAGGMGKTTTLRHLAARECLPDNVPVARIDFDYVESMGMVGATANQPWLLLIPIAKQLDIQFADSPFELFRDSYGSSDVLVDPDADASWIEPTSLVTYFSSLIKRREESVILIFDTMENLRHRGLLLDGIYKLVRDLHEEANNVRVIFSGRFDLREPLPHHPGSITTVEGLSEDLETIEIEPFTPDEAQDYLISRGINRKDKRLPVMKEKGSGNPFKLASLAEFVLINDDITAAELAEIKRSDVEYLIRRIIERIKDDPAVRWVLRYGVVRRSITKEFIEQVMLKFIRDYWEGNRTLDNTERDDITRRRDRGDVFPVPNNDEFDVDRVWSKLKEFAAPYSWIELYVNHGIEEVRFQPDLVVPMRYLLLHPADTEDGAEGDAGEAVEQRSIYRQLHRAAFEWYSRQPQTAEALAEQVYHKFLSLDEDAADFLFDKLKEYDEDDNAVSAMCQRILEELVDTSEFGESEVVKIPDVVKARAELELTWRTITQEGRQLRDTRLPAKQWLLDIDRPLPPELPRDRWATVEAARLLQERRPEEAMKLIVAEIPDPLRHALKHVDRRLLLVLADLLLALPSDHSERHRLLGEEYIKRDFDSSLAGIWEKSNIGPRRDSLWLMLSTKWARLLEENGDFDLAIRLLDEFTFPRLSDVSELGQCAYQLIRLYSKVGQENKTISLLAKYEQFKPPESLDRRQQSQWQEMKDTWQRSLVRESYLALCQTDSAPKQTSDSSKSLHLFPDTEVPAIKSLFESLDARVAAEESDLSRAITIWHRVRQETRLWQATYERVELSLDIARTLFEQELNVREALQELEKLKSEIGRLPGRAVALQAHLLGHSGRIAEARELLQSFYNDHFENASVSDQIPVLIAAIALDLEEIPAFQKLGEATLAVTPATRRLIALDEFAKCQTITDNGAADRLAERLLPTLPTEEESQDPPTAMMRYAEILRVLGRTAEAEETLLRAFAFTDDANSIRPYLWRELLRALDRCGWHAVPIENSQQWLSQLRATPVWSSNSMYRSLMLIEQATRLVDYAQAYDEADRLLEEAKADKDLWRAQYNAAAARVASSLRRNDAREFLDLALKNLEQFDNQFAIWRLMETPEISALSETKASRPDDEIQGVKGIYNALFVLMRLSARHSRYQYPMPADIEIEEQISTSFKTGELDLLGSKESRRLSHEFVEIFAQFWGLIVEVLAKELFENPDLGEKLPPEEGTTLNYGLAVDPAVGWLPWEFSLLNQSFFFKTAQQKHAFFRTIVPSQPSKDRERRIRPKVLVVRDIEAMDRLGGTRSGAYDPISLYKSTGAVVEVLDGLNMERLLDALENLEPDILHVTAKMGQVGDEAVIYESSRGDDQAGNTVGGDLFVRGSSITKGAKYQQNYNVQNYNVEIYPDSFARVIREANISLLILEASSASTLHDRILNLCLRNRFAAEIAEAGVVRHILGVGVAEHTENPILIRRLVEGLCVQGFTPAQVAMKLRRLGAMVINPFWVAADDPAQEDLVNLGQSADLALESFSVPESSVAEILAFSGVALWTADLNESFSRP